MIGGKMIGHRPISTSQHHPGAQRRQLRTGAIEAEQGQRGHGGRKPGKGMNLATSPQNECENRRRRPSRGLAHTPGTPIFALFRWTSERAASIRCPDLRGADKEASHLFLRVRGLPPSGHRIERGTIDLQSDINCLPERSLLGAFGKQHDDYDHDVFNSAGSTLATPHFGPENGVHLSSSEVSNIVSTRARRRWSRAFSRSSSLTRGSSAFAFRPRFLDVIPTLAISSRWRRQLDNCDEYKPSRRRRAATSPSPLPKASASRTIRSLYSAVKRRRFACSTTSGSSTPAASRPAGSTVALRAPSDPAEVSLSTNILMR